MMHKAGRFWRGQLDFSDAILLYVANYVFLLVALLIFSGTAAFALDMPQLGRLFVHPIGCVYLALASVGLWRSHRRKSNPVPWNPELTFTEALEALSIPISND